MFQRYVKKDLVAYLCSLLMQSFPQVSDALVHHRHLGVPLVQQILVLGQLAALLQVMAVTSLKHKQEEVAHTLEDIEMKCCIHYLFAWK